jgi:hypothetical protein
VLLFRTDLAGVRLASSYVYRDVEAKRFGSGHVQIEQNNDFMDSIGRELGLHRKVKREQVPYGSDLFSKVSCCGYENL